MSNLAASDFPRFFRAVHGVPAFPWQTRLATRAVDGSWPPVLALPTGCGKTSVMDIAIFALACRAARGDSAPRRIFFVVDRRLVVDAAYEHARRLAHALDHGTDAIIRDIARQLRCLSGDEAARPLEFFELRGGMYRDEAWARSPLQPAIITSTVDQVGSRLLFRGYGVSDRMRAVHAGLVGIDSLILLDEAHCSNAFRETLQAVRGYATWSDAISFRPLQVVTMSATPPADQDGDEVFRLSDEDHHDATLAARLRATKPTRLVCAAGAKGVRGSEVLAQRIAREAEEISKESPPCAVAVVVNRVRTARAVANHLRGRTDADVELLIGRMRAIDRDPVTRRIESRVSTARRTETLPRSFFLVTTQCVEVGADFDFDRLVTECASFDALRQRYGRLNRSGRPIDGRATVIVREDQTVVASDPTDADPIYGDALPRTWAWLSERAAAGATLDLGVASVDRYLADSQRDGVDLASLSVAAPNAPVLLPAHLDCWVQTSPPPAPEPDPSVFLHGRDSGDRSVHVCWRADLDPQMRNRDAWLQVLSLVPPALSECLSVPFAEVRRWLADPERLADGADIEGGIDEHEVDSSDVDHVDRLAFRWRGSASDQSDFIDHIRELRPDDVLVLPASYGGWTELGHVPSPWNSVNRIDRADEANLAARARPVLRLHRALVECWPEVPSRGSLLALLANFGEEDARFESGAVRLQLVLEDLAHELAAIAEDDPDNQWEWLRRSLAVLCRGPRYVKPLVQHPFGGIILSARRAHKELVAASSPLEATADEDDRSTASAAVTLEGHSTSVRREALRYARQLRLETLEQDFDLAAAAHDLGKADERFQAIVRNASVLEAALWDEVLAKSDRLATTPLEREASRRRAGYPKGARHELVSVRLLERLPKLSGAHDRDLVLHLVATHHGYCRPFALVIDETTPVDVSVTALGTNLSCSSATALERLDSGIAERFWALVRRYGWWGLAYIEALFRLADHAASASAELVDSAHHEVLR